MWEVASGILPAPDPFDLGGETLWLIGCSPRHPPYRLEAEPGKMLGIPSARSNEGETRPQGPLSSSGRSNGTKIDQVLFPRDPKRTISRRGMGDSAVLRGTGFRGEIQTRVTRGRGGSIRANLHPTLLVKNSCRSTPSIVDGFRWGVWNLTPRPSIGAIPSVQSQDNERQKTGDPRMPRRGWAHRSPFSRLSVQSSAPLEPRHTEECCRRGRKCGIFHVIPTLGLETNYERHDDLWTPLLTFRTENTKASKFYGIYRWLTIRYEDVGGSTRIALKHAPSIGTVHGMFTR